MPDDIGSASAAPTAQTGKRFAAFISYSHRDEEFGDWLHKRLESYQVPTALVGRESSVGPIGKRLGKVFRDRADLSAAHDLGREIREGLEESDALIVLCSPRSCGSKYVQDEIRIFKQLGKGQRIFAAIIDGEPHAAGRPGYTAADECFPPSLIFALNHDGSVSSQLEPTEPIAADFRDGKDGRETGSLKIIAGLLDVGLDELVQREKQAERRRRLRANMIAAAMGVLALGAVTAGGYAVWQRQIARLNEERAVAGEALAQQNEARATQERDIAVRERARANYNAEQAQIQELAARRGEAQARDALARIFSERSWQAMDRGDFPLAARYALAGWRASPANEAHSRAALATVLQNSNESTPLVGHTHEIWSVAASPDGGVVVTGSRDQTIRIWDAITGRQLQELQPDQATILALEFSRDGSRLMSAGGNGRVLVWDVSNWRQLAEFRAHPNPWTRVDVQDAAISPDGAQVAIAGTDSVARVWNVATGALVAESERVYQLTEIEYTPDGAALLLSAGRGVLWTPASGATTEYEHRILGVRVHASGDGVAIISSADSAEDTVKIWGRESGRMIAEVREPNVVDARLNLDGSTALTVSASGVVRLWNARTGDLLRTLPVNAAASIRAPTLASASFSPDGSLVLTSSEDRSARVWETASGREIAVLRGHSNLVSAIFASDGASIVTASWDGEARVWRQPRGRNLAPIPLPPQHEAHLIDFAFSPSGDLVLGDSSAEERVYIWNASTGAFLVDHRARVFTMNLEGDRLAIAARSEVRVLRMSDGETMARYEPCSPAREMFFIGQRDVAFLCEGMPWRITTLGEEALRALAFSEEGVLSPDGRYLAVRMNDSVALWRTNDTQRRVVLSAPDVLQVVFSPDASRIAAYGRSGAFVWRLSDGRRLAAIDWRNGSPGLEFSQDGERIISSFGGGARVWDASTGAMITLLPMPTTARLYANIEASFVGPEGALALTRGQDGETVLWDVATARRLIAFGQTREMPAISQDGKRLLMFHLGGTQTVLDLTRMSQPMSTLRDSACSNFLTPSRQEFTHQEALADPLIREVWLRGEATRPVC